MLGDTVVKAKLVELLGKTPSDVQLNITQKILESLLGYPVDEASYDETIDGIGSQMVFLSNLPVNSVSEVYINDIAVEYSKLNSRTIKLNQVAHAWSSTICKGKMIRVPGDQIRVIYTAGWTPETFPDDLVYVAYRILMSKFSSATVQNLTSYRIDTIAYSYRNSAEYDVEIQTYLATYKK